jgi:hypothetical protein
MPSRTWDTRGPATLSPRRRRARGTKQVRQCGHVRAHAGPSLDARTGDLQEKTCPAVPPRGLASLTRLSLVMKGPRSESGRRLLKVLQNGYLCWLVRRRVKCSNPDRPVVLDDSHKPSRHIGTARGPLVNPRYAPQGEPSSPAAHRIAQTLCSTISTLCLLSSTPDLMRSELTSCGGLAALRVRSGKRSATRISW